MVQVLNEVNIELDSQFMLDYPIANKHKENPGNRDSSVPDDARVSKVFISL
jgi:hypothetical protein